MSVDIWLYKCRHSTYPVPVFDLTVCCAETPVHSSTTQPAEWSIAWLSCAAEVCLGLTYLPLSEGIPWVCLPLLTLIPSMRYWLRWSVGPLASVFLSRIAALVVQQASCPHVPSEHFPTQCCPELVHFCALSRQQHPWRAPGNSGARHRSRMNMPQGMSAVWRPAGCTASHPGCCDCARLTCGADAMAACCCSVACQAQAHAK